MVVLTGAGISADSGVPTFRGADGLWRRHRAEELATPAAFARDPRLVWEWYGWRRALVAGCDPNAAHLALARWQAAWPEVHIITQNVDGLHLAAHRIVSAPAAGAGGGGPPSEEPSLYELHGSLFRTRCTGCGQRRESREVVDASSLASLPRCAACGSLLRPDVVWFGESLESEVVERSFELAEGAAACLVIGTSAVVQPAASIAAVAARAGAALVDVNIEATGLSQAADLFLRGRAAEIVPRLLGEPGEREPPGRG